MRHYILGLAALWGALAATPAQAWSQLFNDSGIGSFDHLQMWMVAPDGFRTPRGIDRFSVSGWIQTFNNGQLLIADGPATESLNFRLNFAGPPGDPFTLYFQAWGGSSLLESATLAWGGSGWTIDQGSAWDPGRPLSTLPVHEPSGILLMGAALLGVYLIGRRGGRPVHCG